LLQQLSATAPAGDGRPLIARITPVSGRRFGNQQQKAAKSKPAAQPAPPAAGEEAEGYWPDDDTWLSITVLEELADGSYRIQWNDDQSESEVPADYVRSLAEMPEQDEEEMEDVQETTASTAPQHSIALLEESLETIRARTGYEKMAKREELPSFLEREKIVEAVQSNQVVLLSGETGCGKSTQVPQMVIDSCPGHAATEASCCHAGAKSVRGTLPGARC